MASSVGEPLRNPSADGWKERIIIPTLLAGAVGGGAGLLSKHRKTLGVATVSGSYAANLAIIATCYCGAREVARDARKSGPDDLINSAIGGFASGALLGRLQGGRLGAIRYSIIFTVVGTALDFAALQLRPFLQYFRDTGSEENSQKSGGSTGWWRIPEWSPIQVLDEEALAEKRAREEKLYAQRMLGNLTKEDPYFVQITQDWASLLLLAYWQVVINCEKIGRMDCRDGGVIYLKNYLSLQKLGEELKNKAYMALHQQLRLEYSTLL